MIRTRDFLLYVVVLLFVLLGATYTGFSSRATEQLQAVFMPHTAEAPTFVAYTPKPENDTQSRWQELQARLAAGEGYLAESPADFTSVDQRAIAELSAGASSSQDGFAGNRTVQWCTTSTLSPAIAAWPAVTDVAFVEGQRIVTTVVTETVGNGTTTEEIETNTTVVALPVRTVRSTFESCVPDTLIGVTLTGQPLTNSMAAQFTSVPATQPVGYTRDGFTVYGPLTDPSTLDVCGGRYVAGQYQYHLRLDDPFILGCYAGVPSSI